jgi:hypothetical protein
MGGVGGLLGGQFGRWAGSLGGAVIQGFKVTSPLLQGFIGGTLGGGLGSGLTGFTMSLINGNSLGDAFDARTTFYENGITFSRFAQKAGDGMSYAGYALTLSVVGAEVGVPLAQVGGWTSFGGSVLESSLTAEYSNLGTTSTIKIIDMTGDALLKKLPGATKLGVDILKQNKSLKLSLIEKAVNGEF